MLVLTSELVVPTTRITPRKDPSEGGAAGRPHWSTSRGTAAGAHTHPGMDWDGELDLRGEEVEVRRPTAAHLVLAWPAFGRTTR